MRTPRRSIELLPPINDFLVWCQLRTLQIGPERRRPLPCGPLIQTSKYYGYTTSELSLEIWRLKCLQSPTTRIGVRPSHRVVSRCTVIEHTSPKGTWSGTHGGTNRQLNIRNAIENFIQSFVFFSQRYSIHMVISLLTYISSPTLSGS